MLNVSQPRNIIILKIIQCAQRSIGRRCCILLYSFIVGRTTRCTADGTAASAVQRLVCTAGCSVYTVYHTIITLNTPLYLVSTWHTQINYNIIPYSTWQQQRCSTHLYFGLPMEYGCWHTVFYSEYESTN